VAVGEPRELLTDLTTTSSVLPGRGRTTMSRRLLLINMVLGFLCVAFAVGIVRSLFVTRPLPAAALARIAVAPAPAVNSAPGAVGLEMYAAITAQNLFNPGRSEAARVAAVAGVKPVLHGIVIEGAKSRAFLEDPSIKRVAGYSVGDPVPGGKLEKIADDRVVISRPEGLVEVLLQDPAKPRPTPAVPPVAVATPEPPVQPAPGQQRGAPAQAVLPQAGMAPVHAAATTAYDQVLGQVMPAPVLGNQLSAIPSQSRRRVAAPGQQANE